ncbi:glutamine amidotransferase [Actinocorallia herbida]|uniref:Gamma-glutamyl-hercynylcysteine sulfoxide hydrolase n=1 Tax=Actinocorallia herbida TaxID=58109 RepID=A0A3N1CPJ5_9ACTN|nr:ergothioneine biosynthesis protein EgtC [Actinocorallia herbida]ROO83246.1 glutamine amidotransferase [Actinocorallia herbida]
MCRHLAYLGPPRSLHSLVYGPPHSLERQSWEPKLCTRNKLNADGFGVGWYSGDRTLRYRRAQPIWTDTGFAELSEVLTAGAVVAAVRSATVGFPVEESGAQPLRCERWLFSHNGRVEGFGAVEAKLRELAGDLSLVPEARAPLDSALLFARAVRSWRGGRALAEGLAETVRTVAAIAPGDYNLLASDGTSLAATAWGASLFVRATDQAAVIASEPYDGNPAWQRVPDRSLVAAHRHGDSVRLAIHPLR